MSIESLIGRIIEDAKKASEEIMQKASKDARTWEEKTEREVRAIIDQGKQRAARAAEERKQRMISMAELENRKELLRAKQGLIEEAFSRAVERILSLDDEAYGTFLVNLILQADPVGDEEVLLNDRDLGRFRDGWIGKLNQRLKQEGKKGEMRVGRESRPIKGGAVLRRGRKEINCSLESVVLSKRNELEATVAGILFGDGR
ncbi:MAG: V-type ATP synthase subunit E [Deltaproteobacteria bacterium]|nr:V-type ATP synthase subunit E [Deltaproteobacteria bacterium]MBW2121796.1 V-type ATP synthase subunit E [Deltaproteobacteria bacterium]